MSAADSGRAPAPIPSTRFSLPRRVASDGRCNGRAPARRIFCATRTAAGSGSRASSASIATASFLALKTEWLCDQGAYLTYAGPRISTFNGFLIGAGAYRVRALYGRHKLVLTNCNPIDAYRGAGRPEAALIVERLVDEAAREMRIDPIELRRRNALAPSDFPYTNPNGNVLDSGHPDALLQAVREEAQWNDFPARAQAAAERGRIRGIACALFVEPCGGGFVARRPGDARVQGTENSCVRRDDLQRPRA